MDDPDSREPSSDEKIDQMLRDPEQYAAEARERARLRFEEDRRSRTGIFHAAARLARGA